VVFQTSASNLPRTGQILTDSSQHPVQIFKHIFVLKSYDSDEGSVQIFRAVGIVLPTDGIEVRRAVELNCQAAFGTIKIQDLRTYTVLATKLFATTLRPLEALPQSGFGGR
jgi:hypothetical protein